MSNACLVPKISHRHVLKGEQFLVREYKSTVALSMYSYMIWLHPTNRLYFLVLKQYSPSASLWLHLNSIINYQKFLRFLHHKKYPTNLQCSIQTRKRKMQGETKNDLGAASAPWLQLENFDTKCVTAINTYIVCSE